MRDFLPISPLLKTDTPFWCSVWEKACWQIMILFLINIFICFFLFYHFFNISFVYRPPSEHLTLKLLDINAMTICHAFEAQKVLEQKIHQTVTKLASSPLCCLPIFVYRVSTKTLWEWVERVQTDRHFATKWYALCSIYMFILSNTYSLII